MDGIANHFPAKNALDFGILHIHIQCQSFFPTFAMGTATQWPCAGHNFCLASQHFHCSYFTKWPPPCSPEHDQLSTCQHF